MEMIGFYNIMNCQKQYSIRYNHVQNVSYSPKHNLGIEMLATYLIRKTVRYWNVIIIHDLLYT